MEWTALGCDQDPTDAGSRGQQGGSRFANLAAKRNSQGSGDVTAGHVGAERSIARNRDVCDRRQWRVLQRAPLSRRRPRRRHALFSWRRWAPGSLQTHDGVLRALALAAKCKVIAVEYRKAPEAPFPAAIEDAKAALAFIRSSQSALCIDPSQVIVAGDSSGANILRCSPRLRVMIEIRWRDRCSFARSPMRSSRTGRNKFATGFLLTSDAIDWYLDKYCAKMDREDPGISPLYAEDVSGLAPAFIVAPDHDPLRDDARAYAMRLVEAGVTVTFEEWRGTVHGSIVMDGITPVARQLCRAMADWANHRWTVADYYPR